MLFFCQMLALFFIHIKVGKSIYPGPLLELFVVKKLPFHHRLNLGEN